MYVCVSWTLLYTELEKGWIETAKNFKSSSLNYHEDITSLFEEWFCDTLLQKIVL